MLIISLLFDIIYKDSLRYLSNMTAGDIKSGVNTLYPYREWDLGVHRDKQLLNHGYPQVIIIMQFLFFFLSHFLWHNIGWGVVLWLTCSLDTQAIKSAA